MPSGVIAKVPRPCWSCAEASFIHNHRDITSSRKLSHDPHPFLCTVTTSPIMPQSHPTKTPIRKLTKNWIKDSEEIMKVENPSETDIIIP